MQREEADFLYGNQLFCFYEEGLSSDKEWEKAISH